MASCLQSISRAAQNRGASNCHGERAACRESNHLNQAKPLRIRFPLSFIVKAQRASDFKPTLTDLIPALTCKNPRSSSGRFFLIAETKFVPFFALFVTEPRKTQRRNQSHDQLGSSRLMGTTLHIQARVRNHQPLHGPISDNMLIQNFIHICSRHPAIPHGVRIHHHRRPVLALIEASGFVGTHLSFQSPCRHAGLKQLMNLGSSRIARSFRVSFRPLIGAYKNVSLKLRHFLDVISLFRSPKRWVDNDSLKRLQRFGGQNK